LPGAIRLSGQPKPLAVARQDAPGSASADGAQPRPAISPGFLGALRLRETDCILALISPGEGPGKGSPGAAPPDTPFTLCKNCWQNLAAAGSRDFGPKPDSAGLL